MNVNFLFMNLPNTLTFIRIACVPLVCIGIFHSFFAFALIVFMIASGTDYLDGYFAQRFQSQTAFGALLDPLADKLLVILTWFFLASTLPLSLLQISAMALMTFREILILGLRQLPQHTLPVIPIAKWKTFFQMLGTMTFIAAQIIFPLALYPISVTLLSIACFLSLLSAFAYLSTVYKTYFP